MGFSIRNSRLVSVGLAGVIAVGVVGATAVAFADEPDGGSQQANPDNGARKHHPIVLGVSALLKDSGVTRDELKQGGQDGLTLAQIIDQYGDISSAQAKQHALDALSTRLDEAVASGKIKQEEADKIEANSPAMLDKLLAAVPGEHRGDKHPRIHAIAKNALETVANVLGTDVATLRQQLAGGQTIAEIAGPQTQAVIDALTSDANAAIDKAVENGNLPADKADDAKAKAAQAIEKFVNEGLPKRPDGAKPHREAGPKVRRGVNPSNSQ
jgi:hypothetical protein